MQTIRWTFRAITCAPWDDDVVVDVLGDADSVQLGEASHRTQRAQSGSVPHLPYPLRQANIELMDL